MKIKIITILLLLLPAASWAVERHSAEYFSFTVEVAVKGSTDTVFEAITGDISGWWDHSFSENPLKLYVDPFPGGAFMEIFDKDGFGGSSRFWRGGRRNSGNYSKNLELFSQ